MDGPAPLPITLALQGGGSLGAFAWGVLDRLLEEERLRPEVVSGASAGAMNAALLVQGLATGGPEEAKRLLELFWRRVAMAAGSPDVADLPAWLMPMGDFLFPLAQAWRRSAASGFGGPPRAPLVLNPLRRVLDGLLEPEAFARPGAPMLVVSATRVRTGEARLFRGAEVTADVLLASACLPQIFPPVEIDGELYWDGGYASNPPVRPLIEAGAPADVVIVRTTPLERPTPPQNAREIRARSTEIAFDAALRQELRSVLAAQRLLAAELPNLPEGGALARLRDARLHIIGAEEELRALPQDSPQDARWELFRSLRELGRGAAERWLSGNLAAIGHRSTLDGGRFDNPR
jgi:NTE family protein